mmetsp:Transcript_65250/g.183690  ORF Transcript_65250/g.183690 Transcript_65250/m.183690 type:complete len:506 (+) Transcript_65250:144-1661(+)
MSCSPPRRPAMLQAAPPGVGHGAAGSARRRTVAGTAPVAREHLARAGARSPQVSTRSAQAWLPQAARTWCSVVAPAQVRQASPAAVPPSPGPAGPGGASCRVRVLGHIAAEQQPLPASSSIGASAIITGLSSPAGSLVLKAAASPPPPQSRRLSLSPNQAIRTRCRVVAREGTVPETAVPHPSPQLPVRFPARAPGAACFVSDPECSVFPQVSVLGASARECSLPPTPQPSPRLVSRFPLSSVGLGSSLDMSVSSTAEAMPQVSRLTASTASLAVAAQALPAHRVSQATVSASHAAASKPAVVLGSPPSVSRLGIASTRWVTHRSFPVSPQMSPRGPSLTSLYSAVPQRPAAAPAPPPEWRWQQQQQHQQHQQQPQVGRPVPAQSMWRGPAVEAAAVAPATAVAACPTVSPHPAGGGQSTPSCRGQARRADSLEGAPGTAGSCSVADSGAPARRRWSHVSREAAMSTPIPPRGDDDVVEELSDMCLRLQQKLGSLRKDVTSEVVL